jgi:hypothetical protein
MLLSHMRIGAVPVIGSAYHSHYDDHHSEHGCTYRLIKAKVFIADEGEAYTASIGNKSTVRLSSGWERDVCV